MESKQTQENTKQTSIRIPMDIYREIEVMAEENTRTVADQIRHMLKKYIEITSTK